MRNNVSESTVYQKLDWHLVRIQFYKVTVEKNGFKSQWLLCLLQGVLSRFRWLLQLVASGLVRSRLVFSRGIYDLFEFFVAFVILALFAQDFVSINFLTV